MLTLKNLVRGLTPPLLWQFISKLYRGQLFARPPLRGVYKTANEIPQENQWESEKWLNQQSNSLSESASQSPSFLPHFKRPLDLTALFLNCLSAENKISVLDFGGASGELYFYLVRGGRLLYGDNVDWTVVDNQATRALGEKAKKETDNINFIEKIIPSKTFDVLHIASVFQYIDDVEALIETLLKEANPKHVLLTRLSGGPDNPDYFTDNYSFGRHTPYHILNLRHLSSVFEKHGFHSVFRASNTEESRTPDFYEDVPLEYQVYYSAHLFFSR